MTNLPAKPWKCPRQPKMARLAPESFAILRPQSCGGERLAVSFCMFKALIGVAAWCGMMGGVLASGGGGGCAGGGGGGGFCGFGGDSGYSFALPKVEEDVAAGGLTIKLDRTKWGYSVFDGVRDGLLARFVGEDIEVTLRRIAPLPVDGRMLVKALSSKQDVLYARSIATSGALRGVKAAYGVRHSFRSPSAKLSPLFFCRLGSQLAVLRSPAHREGSSVAGCQRAYSRRKIESFSRLRR